MAELPDSNIVQLPAPGSRRPVSTIDTSAISRAGAALASGAETLGRGITSAAQDAAVVFKQEQAAALRLGSASASAVMQSGLLEDAAAIDAEKDPTDLEEKYKTKVSERLNAARQFIKDERQKQLFDLSQQDNIARVIQAAKRKEFSLLSEAEMAADYASMRQAGEHAIGQSAGNPKAMDLAIGTVHGYVDKWVEKGYMTPAKAGEYKQKAALDLAERKLLALPLPEKHEALSSANAAQSAVQFFVGKGLAHHAAAGIVGNLLQESGALDPNQSHDNGTGVGIAGWRLERREALKKFAAERSLQWNTREAQLEFLWHELNTSEKGVLQGLKDAKDAREAAHAFISFERPAGWTAGKPELGHGYANRIRNAESIMAGGGGGRYAGLVSIIPAGRLEQMRMQAEREYDQARTKASHDAFNGWQRQIIDAANGQDVLPERRVIETDGNLLPQDANHALAMLDSAARDVATLKNFTSSVQGGHKPNPEDPEAHKQVDRYFKANGGNQIALRKTLDDTGILPKSVAIDLQGNIQSADTKIVAAAMEFISSLPPSALVKVEGHDQLREAANVFQAGQTTRKSPMQIAAEYKEDRDERRKDPVKYAKIKESIASQIDGIVTIGFVQRELRSSGWKFEIGGSNRDREEIISQVQAHARRLYQKYDSKDPRAAVRQAVRDIAFSYGPSTAVGPSVEDPTKPRTEKRLVQYAPTAVPMYNDGTIDDPDLRSKQAAVKMMRDMNSVPSEFMRPRDNIKPENIIIEASPLFDETGKKFYANNPDDPPIYVVSYSDSKGIRHLWGKVQFTPQELRDAQFEDRKAIHAKGEAKLQAERDQGLLDTPGHKVGRLSPEEQARRSEMIVKREEERSAQQADRLVRQAEDRARYVDPVEAALRPPPVTTEQAAANRAATAEALSAIGSKIAGVINPPSQRKPRRAGE
jgi:hypothetical protein